MFTLKTTDDLVHLESYQDLKEELQHLRSSGSAEIEWFEENGARFVSEFIKIEGKFVEVFVFQSSRKKNKAANSDLFNDLGEFTQGMS